MHRDDMAMLIRTKLNRPRLGDDLISRPALVARLERGRTRKLTLISAPAGYGKTALASAWSEACACPVAWLSLDKNDSDVRTFVLYLIAAIQTVFPDTCVETQGLLNGSRLPTPAYLAMSLVNETSALSEPALLVLDDYHAVTGSDVQQFVATLIQYQPGNLHLVIVTRQDPILGLVNLRAGSQVTEIRAGDLRFSRNEGQRFLEKALRRKVSPDLAARLEERTEGWPAGLRLAYLALREQGDEVDFLEKFHGTNQYVMSYLVDEVLARQSQAVQTFLLCTSILDRFCAPLASALLAAYAQGASRVQALPLSSSTDILGLLQKTNLFLVPIDQEGVWFRYHQLLQDLLRYRLKAQAGASQLAALHTAAGDWLAQQGYVDEALDHYLAANDIDAAVQLVAGQRYRLLNETRWQQLEQYLRRFSPAIVNQNADLLIVQVWLLYHRGQWGRLPTALRQLDVLLDEASLAPEAVRHLRGEMSALYALLAYQTARADEAIAHAHVAIKNAPPQLWIVRSLARICLGVALQMKGDSRGAYAVAYDAFAAEEEQSDHFKATELLGTCYICWIAADLRGLLQAAEQISKLSRDAPNREIEGDGRHHAGAAAYQRNDLTRAEAEFSFVAQRPYRNYGHPYVYSAIGLSLTFLAQKRGNAANQEVRNLVDFLVETGNRSLLPVAQAFEAEVALRQGNLAAAGRWAARFTEPPPPVPVFALYSPHLTLAKIWLAQNTAESRQRAADLLSRLESFYTSIHNTRFLLEVLAIQALLFDHAGDKNKALAVLEQALTLAQPGGLIRVFVDLGPQMARLLLRLKDSDPALRPYIRQILAAFDPAILSPAADDRQAGNGSGPVETLTDREYDILFLLGERKTNREIATTLVISENTVRFHLKNLFSKLDVSNRRQAARRARELGLLPLD